MCVCPSWVGLCFGCLQLSVLSVDVVVQASRENVVVVVDDDDLPRCSTRIGITEHHVVLVFFLWCMFGFWCHCVFVC